MMKFKATLYSFENFSTALEKKRANELEPETWEQIHLMPL